MKTYCYEAKKECNKQSCRYWIECKEHHNCCVVAAQTGPITFDEISKLLHISKTQTRITLNKAIDKLHCALSKLND